MKASRPTQGTAHQRVGRDPQIAPPAFPGSLSEGAVIRLVTPRRTRSPLFVIASQCAHWRGNPSPTILLSLLTHQKHPEDLPSGCRKAFPAHGEGGPLAVDEVPAKRIKDSIVSGQVGRGTVPCPIGGARNHPLSHFCMLSSSRRGGVGMRSKTKAPSPCLN